MADTIDMPFGVVGQVGPRNDVLDREIQVLHMGRGKCWEKWCGAMERKGKCDFGRAKTAEPVEMPFGLAGVVGGPMSRLLDGREHSRHLANIVERFFAAAMSGHASRDGDAACSQFCYYYCC